jgi:hypothetical protein
MTGIYRTSNSHVSDRLPLLFVGFILDFGNRNTQEGGTHGNCTGNWANGFRRWRYELCSQFRSLSIRYIYSLQLEMEIRAMLAIPFFKYPIYILPPVGKESYFGQGLNQIFGI